MDWKRMVVDDKDVPEIFRDANLRNAIHNGQITDIFERENAINYLKIRGHW